MKKGFTSPLLFWPVLACALLSPLHAAPPDLRDLLRDGLYKEEVNRDPEGAAKTYQDLLARNDEQRAFAATAQFRLAEVRRKQGRKDEAIEAYRQLLIRYPEAETECRIARENLTAMGAAAPSTEGAPQGPSPAAPEDGDEAFLATLKDIQTKAPDTLGNKENFDKAITQGYTKSVSFLLKNAPPSSQTPVLTMAVEAGSLEMVKLIYANGVKPNADESRMLLALAAAKNQFFIAQELLKQGIDVNGVPNAYANMLPPVSIDSAEKNHKSIAEYLPGTALTTAIAFGNPKLVELILQANPDVNARLTDKSYPPLTLATLNGDLSLVKELLARHADPNLTSEQPRSDGFLRTGRYNLSENWQALDVAVALNAPEIAKLIVQSGGTLQNKAFLLKEEEKRPPRRIPAAGQRGTSKPDDSDDDRPAFSPWVKTLIEDGIKPADLPNVDELVSRANTEELKLLLDHGLDPSQLKTLYPIYFLPPGKLQLLLDHGLDPNRTENEVSLFSFATGSKRPDLIPILLERGAKVPAVDEQGNSVLGKAAEANFPDEILNALIDQGATLSDEWFKSDAYLTANSRRYSQRNDLSPTARVRTLLFRRLLMPKLKASPDIRLALQTPWGTKLETLESKSPSAHPESLERILTTQRNKIDWYSRADGPSVVTIWRTGSDGKLSSQVADLRADAAFPSLEWGDLVELSYAQEDQEIFGGPANANPTDNPPPAPDSLIWKLRQRITFPVTVEMDGQAQELTMTGALITFDPTQSSVPLMGAAQLAQLISQKKPDRYFGDTVTVIRQGWPEVRLLTGSSPGADFELQKGDRIQWKTQDKPAGPQYLKNGPEIRIFSPGLPFNVRFEDLNTGGSVPYSGFSTDTPAPSSAPRPSQPSLLQALATIYSPITGMLKNAPGAPAELAAWIPAGLQGTVISVLPHPDLAHIRIHRKAQGGSEEIIEVDLQKAIEALTPESSTEEARRADVLLRPGDEVELPVLRDQLDHPWKGFSAAQQHLLERALSGSIQILQRYSLGSSQPLQLVTLAYRAPRIIDTPGGLIPLPATEGTSSLLASDVLPPGQYDASTTEGLRSGMDSYRMFVSERFQFIQTPPPQPAQPNQPRPAGRR